MAFQHARAKLDGKCRSVWAKVAGPATAFVAIMRRINWAWVDNHTVKDDVGNVLVFGLDAPKTFAAAAQASVRRWRVAQIGIFSTTDPNTRRCPR